jgi:beta-1,4-mannosyltransferase
MTRELVSVFPPEADRAASVPTAASQAGARRRTIASFPPPLERNPYQRLLYRHLEAEGFELVVFDFGARDLWRNRKTVGLLHFHWPQGYWRYNRNPLALRGTTSALVAVKFAAKVALARVLGYRIAWTVHQVDPHESVLPPIDRTCARLLARTSDLLFVHDEATAAALSARFGGGADGKLRLVPHGSYIGVYPAGRPREDVRESLGIGERALVILCFGDLRAYKDVGRALDAFLTLKDPHAVLLVAGAGSDDLSAEVRAAAARDPRIRPRLMHIPDDEVAELYGAADVGLLPRHDGGTSGALVLALSMGLPVVAADTSSYRGLTRNEDAGWLFEPGSTESLRRALERAASSGERARDEKGAAARRCAERLDWPGIARRVARDLRGATA